MTTGKTGNEKPLVGPSVYVGVTLVLRNWVYRYRLNSNGSSSAVQRWTFLNTVMNLRVSKNQPLLDKMTNYQFSRNTMYFSTHCVQLLF